MVGRASQCASQAEERAGGPKVGQEACLGDQPGRSLVGGALVAFGRQMRWGRGKGEKRVGLAQQVHASEDSDLIGARGTGQDSKQQDAIVGRAAARQRW